MKFHILIHLSESSIGFYYCRTKSDDRSMRPFLGEWPAPLAVYVHGNELEIGKSAYIAATNQVEGAYADLFQLAGREEYFEFNGSRRNLNKLLLVAIEHYFQKFLREHLSQQAGALEDIRGELSVSFIFDVNLSLEKKEYVLDLFRNNGYNNIRELDYNQYLLDEIGDDLSPMRKRGNLVVMSAYGDDIYFRNYLEGKGGQLVCLPAVGTDGRLDKAKELISRCVLRADAWIDLEQEKSRIDTAAREFVDSGRPSVNAYLELSTGLQVPYFITSSSLGSDTKDSDRLRAVLLPALAKEGVRPEAATLVLKDERINSNFFRSILTPLFAETIPFHGDYHSKLLNRIAAELLAQSDRVPPISYPGNNDVPDQQNDDDTLTPPPPQPKFDAKALMKMGREMRIARANINAKYSRGDKVAASNEYRALLEAWENAAPAELLSELHDWLANKGISRDDLLKVSNQTKASKSERPRPTVSTKPRDEEGKSKSEKNEKKPVVNEMTEGERLLKSGNFSEAKRFFAGVGNEHMKQLCIDLLRDSRDLKAMASQNLSSLSPTARKNNLDKLKRIKTNYLKAGLSAQKIEDLIGKLK